MKVLPDSMKILIGIAGFTGGLAIANLASFEYSEYPTMFFDLN
jgi:hypothetical protein